MYRINKIFLIFITLFMSKLAQAIIWGAETFTDAKGTHPTVTLLYSSHIDKPNFAITNHQRREIIVHALNQKMAIASEDLFAFEGDNKIIKDALEKAKNNLPEKSCDLRLKIKGEDSFGDAIADYDCMTGLLDELKGKTCIANVECRHHKFVSLKAYEIAASEVWKFYHELTDNILNRKTDRAFELYSSIIKSFWKDNKDLLGFMKQAPDKNLTELFEEQLKEMPGFSEYLTMFDACLVDVMMLRALDVCRGCKHIIMIAGGEHCQKVSGYLQTLGYTSSATKINRPVKTFSVDASIGYLEIDPLDIGAYFKRIN